LRLRRRQPRQPGDRHAHHQLQVAQLHHPLDAASRESFAVTHFQPPLVTSVRSDPWPLPLRAAQVASRRVAPPTAMAAPGIMTVRVAKIGAEASPRQRRHRPRPGGGGLLPPTWSGSGLTHSRQPGLARRNSAAKADDRSTRARLERGCLTAFVQHSKSLVPLSLSPSTSDML